MVSEEEYVKLAPIELKALLSALDRLESDELEVELENDILTLEFGDGAKYIVNSHRAARQIWMAADRSAWHYDFLPEVGKWVAQKSGDELWSTLERALSGKLGIAVNLKLL